jgi:peptidoglycan hydrolase CwlO-like protein
MEHMFTQAIRTAVTAVTATTLALGGFSLAIPENAFADGGDTGAQVSELQKKVEQTAAAYDEATAKVNEVQKRIDDNDARIADIKKQLPRQKKRAAEAMNAMYKMQNQRSGLLDVVFNISSIDQLITTADYLNTIQSRNADAIQKLDDAQTELKQKSEQLASDKKEAKQEQQKAKQASDEAIAAREEAQRKAEEEAKKEAAEAAKQAAAAKKKAASQESSSKSAKKSSSSSAASSKSSKQSTKKSSSDSGSTSKSSSSSANENPPSGVVSTGDVDWSVGKSRFISTWTSRIDNYLSGSPLAGQGATFATAAWNYGVDPRWSPAIAHTESSLGAACFKPHNAWGWGSSSWGSWEDAINEQVAGLAHGYGTTISITAAKKYCPPNWQNWYNKTLAQMNAM